MLEKHPSPKEMFHNLPQIPTHTRVCVGIWTYRDTFANKENKINDNIAADKLSKTTERFWKKVKKTDTCWIWLASKGNSGYGNFWNGSGKFVPAHRWSYEQEYKPVPQTLFVCHHCDNPICVRPSHLFVGDQFANMQDAATKGRVRGWWSTAGAVHPNEGKSLNKGIPWSESRREKGNKKLRVLTPEQEAVVKTRWASGEFQKDIAKDYGIWQGTVSTICRRKT